jgi:hypothetical protein
MIKYDWEKVQRLCLEEPNDIIWYLAYRSGVYTKNLSYINDVNKRIYDAAKKPPLPAGNSFIINPTDLFKNECGASITAIYEYIVLASNRQLFDYKVKDDKTLHLNIALALGMNYTEYNSLLTVKDRIIYFKYEQKTTEVRNGD